ncbi:hypothetical protein J4Q44_G00090220 [Coregonus suidteri]|uniref:Uncharacterized protein n=1 Tax=Coregonus suidteri TaxID=861788 RepID=A0AAN8M8V6_9TELE
MPELTSGTTMGSMQSTTGVATLMCSTNQARSHVGSGHPKEEERPSATPTYPLCSSLAHGARGTSTTWSLGLRLRPHGTPAPHPVWTSTASHPHSSMEIISE